MATAVRASISAPVFAVAATVARISTDEVLSSKSTVTDSRGNVCARGTSSLVRLAPWMPATRAVGSASALRSWLAASSSSTAGVVSRRPVAIAVRRVIAFPPMSIIRDRP